MSSYKPMPGQAPQSNVASAATIDTGSRGGKGSPLSFLPQPIYDPLLTEIPDRIATGIQQGIDEGIIQPIEQGVRELRDEVIDLGKEVGDELEGVALDDFQSLATRWAILNKELERLNALDEQRARYQANLDSRNETETTPQTRRDRINTISGAGLAQPSQAREPLGNRMAQLGPRGTLLSGPQGQGLGV